MAKRKYLGMAAVVGTLAVAFLALGVTHAFTQGRPLNSVPPRGNPQRMPPMLQPPSVAVGSTTDPYVGLTLSAPKKEMAKGLTGEDAAALSWNIEGAPGRPTGVRAMFGILNWGDRYKDVPVWLITYEGACVPRHGPAPGSDSSCGATIFNTLIDATNRTYVASFADGFEFAS